MQSQNHPPSPKHRQQRPPPLQQPEKAGLRTKLPAGIMMLSPKESISPRPVLSQLRNSNTAHPATSSDEDSYANSQFSGTAKSKNSFGVPEASPSPDKLFRTPGDFSAPSSRNTSPDFNHYRSRMQSSPSGHPSPTDTDMYTDENSTLSHDTSTIEAPTDMYTFATAAASILQQAREEEDARSVSDASSVASADATPLKNYKSSHWTNRNDGSVMDSYRNSLLGTPPAPMMMDQRDKYGNDLNPLSPFRPDYTYSDDDDDNLLDVSSSDSSNQIAMYPPAGYTPGSSYTPQPSIPSDNDDDTPVKKNTTPNLLPTVSPYIPGSRVNPTDESAIDWQHYNEGSSTPPRALPSMLGDSDSCDVSGAELESPARFLRSTKVDESIDEEEEPPKVEYAAFATPNAKNSASKPVDLDITVDSEESAKVAYAAFATPEVKNGPFNPVDLDITVDSEEPTNVEPTSTEPAKVKYAAFETPQVKEPPKKNAPILNDFYSKPGLMSPAPAMMSPGEQSMVFSLDDCKALAGQAETPGAKSIEFSLDVCQADPELAMKPFLLQQSNSADSTIPEDADEAAMAGMFKPEVSKAGSKASKQTKTRTATKKKHRGDKEVPSGSANGANGQTDDDGEKPASKCCTFSLRCKLFGLLFLALLVFAPIAVGKWRDKDLKAREHASANDFPTASPVLGATDSTEAPTVERSTSKRPTNKGSGEPSQPPAFRPTAGVTLMPTLPTVETKAPTFRPVPDATKAPSITQTDEPLIRQSVVPTQAPTNLITNVPTVTSSAVLTTAQTETPTMRPTNVPTVISSTILTTVPTETSSMRPTTTPTQTSSGTPTTMPTKNPTKRPTNVPTFTASGVPTESPTIRNTDQPTPSPSIRATDSPTNRPTGNPTPRPTVAQTRRPTTTGGTPVGRPSRPLNDANAPIGRPSLGERPTVVEPEPTLAPIWSGMRNDVAMDDANMGETHWPQFDSKTGLRMEILSTLETQWQPALEASVNEWNAFESVELTVTDVPRDEECEPVWGKIKICNDNFGETNWRSSIEVYFRSGNIVAVAVQVNDFYTLDQGWAQYTLCHQLGHAFGFGNAMELNCMRPVSLYSDAVPLQLRSPDNDMGEQLYDAYGPISNGQRQLELVQEVKHVDRVVRYTV